MQQALLPVLEARGIEKSYGNVQVLYGVDLAIYSNQVVALVGDNGAGKSTLISVLSGVRRPDAGTIYVDGEPANLDSPARANRFGIVSVYQDLALVDERDVASNIFLGQEITRAGFLIDKKAMVTKARDVINKLKVGLPDVHSNVKDLSGGQRQALAVARSIVHSHTRLVIMDEPTAALGVREAARVSELIRGLRDDGRAVLLISHNMDTVFDLADRIIVLRLGHKVADLQASKTSKEEVIRLIVSDFDSVRGFHDQD